MRLSSDEFLDYLTNNLLQRFLLKIEATMKAQYEELKTRVDTLAAAVTATAGNEAALKSKLDTAIADNVAKQAALDAAAVQAATLAAQLAAAQAAATDPAELAAVEAANVALTALTQTLLDASAITAPSN